MAAAIRIRIVSHFSSGRSLVVVLAADTMPSHQALSADAVLSLGWLSLSERVWDRLSLVHDFLISWSITHSRGIKGQHPLREEVFGVTESPHRQSPKPF